MAAKKKTKKKKPATCIFCKKPVPEDRRGGACQACNQETANSMNSMMPFPLFRGG